ncbi:TPA: hypothetical protein N0F65_006969 [Lagenidium giganteum]|uniref:C2H2-type domain-containing protein n=1 Tax=Lagenidium giganteum TaxID=4803 RepID=A0AAV2ZJ93_9STRA|nr:TPA: hypothetical protein N0F65_006969 [Lagenidium giganteum]
MDELRFRWQRHVGAYRGWSNGKGSEISIYPFFNEHGLNQFKMILRTAVNKNNGFKINRLTQKQHYENNNDNISVYNRKYYEANKDKLNEKNRERTRTRFDCECGGKYSLSSKSNHFKGKKHQKWQQAQN